ncbi:MAG: SGNH/GDSL hydrolase family protein [Candidatus Sumerlaeaceae bacterium]
MSPTRRRRVLFAIVASLLGLLFGLLLLEVSVRIFLVRRAGFIDQLHEHVSREWGGDLTLWDIIRPAADVQRVYEMIAGANGRFVGQPLVINRDGFRDGQRAKAKPGGITRVAVLGDSIAFGWGVRQEERFSDQLELMGSTSSSRVEVLNFAVPGYNTVMELATLREKVLGYEPDVLLLSLVDNDDEVPNFVRIRPQAWSPGRCFILETIRDQMIGRKLGDTARLALGGIAEAGGIGHGRDVIGFRPELVPAEYRFLVGEEPMVQALKDLVREATSHGIIPLCVLHRMYSKPSVESAGVVRSERLMQFATEAGFKWVDPAPALLQYLFKNRRDEKSLWINKDDLHPNAVGHKIIAEQLLPAVRAALEESSKK